MKVIEARFKTLDSIVLRQQEHLRFGLTFQSQEREREREKDAPNPIFLLFYSVYIIFSIDSVKLFLFNDI